MPESSEQDVPSKLAEYNTDMYGKHKAFRGNRDDENDRNGILEKGHLRRCHTDYLALPESRLQMLRCFFSLVDYSPPFSNSRNTLKFDLNKNPGMLCDGSLNNAGFFSIQFLAALYSFLRLQLPRIISSFTWFVGWLKSANTSVFKGFLTWVYYSESVNSAHDTRCTQILQPP